MRSALTNSNTLHFFITPWFNVLPCSPFQWITVSVRSSLASGAACPRDRRVGQLHSTTPLVIPVSMKTDLLGWFCQGGCSVRSLCRSMKSFFPFRDAVAQIPGSARVIPQACLRFGSSLVSVEEKNVEFPSSPFPSAAGARNRHYAPAVFRLRLKINTKFLRSRNF